MFGSKAAAVGGMWWVVSVAYLGSKVPGTVELRLFTCFMAPFLSCFIRCQENSSWLALCFLGRNKDWVQEAAAGRPPRAPRQHKHTLSRTHIKTHAHTHGRQEKNGEGIWDRCIFKVETRLLLSVMPTAMHYIFNTKFHVYVGSQFLFI